MEQLALEGGRLLLFVTSFQVLGSVLCMYYYSWLTELHEVAATMGAPFW